MPGKIFKFHLLTYTPNTSKYMGMIWLMKVAITPMSAIYCVRLCGCVGIIIGEDESAMKFTNNDDSFVKLHPHLVCLYVW
jgi:hypothetical protein